MLQNSKITGYAKSKFKLKLVTIEQTKVLAAALSVYASSIKDEVLLSKANITTKLNRSTKEELLSTIEEVILMATDLSAELLPFGITP